MRPIVGKLPQLLLFLALIGAYWIYAPGSAEVLILDDKYSIVGIDLHSGLEQTFLQRLEVSGSGGPTGRPVSTATFIIESVYLETSIAQRKLFSIVLHLINAILVFILLRKLFRSAAYSYSDWLALVFAVFWLISPVLVSTTLYLVQRMSLLAALFVLSGCLIYLYWRDRYLRGSTSWVAFVLFSGVFILASLSKENGVLLLPIVIAIELCWFRGESCTNERVASLHKLFGTIAVGASLVLLLVVIYFYPSLQAGFENRSFSLWERILTQSRVLWDYAIQFFSPDITKMGIYHDDWPVSTGFLSPVSTAYAFFGWAFFVGLGFLLWFNNILPRLSLGIYFFLIAHSLEASVLPLELYFEHRNYLPSIGLIILAGTVLGEISRHWSAIVPPLLAWAAVWCLVVASQAGILTQIWSSNRLLAFHHINGHPKSFRANGDIAFIMASVGDQELALRYSGGANSFSEESDLDYLIRDLTLSCISAKEFPVDGWSRVRSSAQTMGIDSATGLHQYLRQVSGGECAVGESTLFTNLIAMAILDDADSLRGTSNDVLYLLAELHFELSQYDRASRYVDVLLMRDNQAKMYQTLKRRILHTLEREEDPN